MKRLKSHLLQQKRKLLPFFLGLLIFLAVPLLLLSRTAKADSLFGFDEGYGTSVTNTSGSVTGTITGASWKTGVECTSGNCLYFDGLGDYINLGDNSSYDFNQSASFTIEFWFRTPEIASGTRTFVSKYVGDDAEGGYKIYLNSSGNVCMGIDDDNAWEPDGYVCTDAAYDDSQWHHMAFVKSGTLSLTMFVDSAQEAQNSSISTIGSLENDDSFIIGADATGTNNFFKGIIDELRIYTSARTSDQIVKDSQMGSSVTGSSATFGKQNSWISDGLVGYWKMDTAANLEQSLNYSITADADDGWEYNRSDWDESGYSFSGELWIGFYSVNEEAGFKFQNITVPRYAKITSAYMTFVSCGSSGTGELDFNIFAEDADNASNWSMSSRPSTFTPTTAIARWTTTAVSAGNQIQTSDFSPVVQEVVNRAGWSPGNSMKFAILNNLAAGDRDLCVSDLSHPSYNGASLSITYEVVVPESDHSGGGQTLVSGGSVSTSGGKIGRGLDFESTTSDYLYHGKSWPNTSYAKRIGITVDPTKVSGSSDLANFPLMVTFTNEDLKSLSNGGSVTSSNGYDIIFVDSLNNVLNHEIEKYDPTTGEIVAWIKIPTLYTAADTNIYMYFGNPAITTSQENVEGTWNSEYKMVHHLNETSGQHFDSTSNNADSTGILVANQGNAVGKINGANDFEGSSSNYVNLGPLDYATGAMTISAWFKGETLLSETRLIAKAPSATASQQYWMLGIINSSGFKLNARLRTGTTTTSFTGTKVLRAGDWYYGSFVYNGSTVRLYINGVDVGGAAKTGTVAVSNTVDTSIGMSPNGSSYFDGIIDEVRISTAALSADWLATEFNNQGYPYSFYEISDVEEYSPNALALTGSLTISGWVKPESNTAGTQYNIAGQWDGADEHYLLAQYGDEIRLYLGSSSNYVTTDNANLAVGTWYLVSAVYNSVSQTGTIYINGVPTGTTVTGTIPSSLSGSVNRFHIGAEDSSTTAVNFYDGVIDEVILYNRALEAVEVQQLAINGPGPVAHYAFDEGSGTSTIYDRSGNNHHLTMNGMLNSGWVTGKVGGAFSFDGSNDYASLYYDSDFDFGTEDFTINGWFRKPELGVGPNSSTYILSRYDNDQGYKIWVDDTGHLNFGVDDDNSWTPDDAATTSITVDDNRWHFFSAQKTSLGLFVFVDGTLAASNTSPTALNTLTSDSAPLTLGSDEPTNGGYWDGELDNIQIYNYHRQVEQVTEDMNAGHPAPGSPVGSALIHWKIDEGYGDTANSSGSSSISGNMSGALDCPTSGSCPSWTNNGKFGKALSFDGTNDYVSSSTAIDLTNINVITLSFWMNWDAYANDDDMAIESSTDLNSNDGAIFVLPNSSYGNLQRFQFTIQESPSASAYRSESIIRPSAGAWHHYAAVFDNSTPTGEITVYVDGILQQTNLDVDTKLTAGDFGNYTWYFMSRAGTSLFGAGKIDEFKLFTFGLTSDQVKTLYSQSSTSTFGSLSTEQTGSGSYSSNRAYCVPGDTTQCDAPIAEWKFDDNTGTSAHDTSGNNNHSNSFQGAPAWTPGKFGPAIKLNGSSDYLLMTNNNSSLNLNDEITIEAWVKTDNNSDETIIMTGHNDGNNPAYKLEIDGSGRLTFVKIYNSYYSTDTYTWNDGWHHVAVTFIYGNDNSAKLYRDGAEIPGTWLSGIDNALPTNYDVTKVGYNGTSWPGYFAGTIDEIKMFDYVRTLEQIKWSYNRGEPAVWYKFDECSGTTIYNSAPNANGQSAGFSGSLVIGPLGDFSSAGSCGSNVSTESWNMGESGNFNAGLALDGTDDYVSITDTTASPLDLTGDATLAAWIKSDLNSTTQTIVQKGINSGYSFYIDSSGHPSLFIYPGPVEAVSSAVISADNWYHLVAVKDGTDVDFYINGAYVDSGTVSGTIATDNNILNIGTSNGDGYFNGIIDGVRIYNYALTPDQIRVMHNRNSAVSF